MRVVQPHTFTRYQRELEQHIRQTGREVGHNPKQVEGAVDRRLRRARGEAFAALLDESVGLADKRVLDVGSGFGEFVFGCLARGAQAEGVEPDEERVHISSLLLESFGLPQVIQAASGEALPFEDGVFDVVASQHVLEHVSDVDRVVSEMVRVTRPGGHLLVSVPNYLFPYEGHYKMRWFPLTPKLIGRWILRLRGRDPRFLLEHVHYTTYPQMMRIWRRHNLEIQNITRARIVGGTHESQVYDKPLLKALALKLNLFPTVTWLLRKPPEI
jgi:2-polyprenyl-3-methyl-5-hydroxy-6-metoxy-1,4-benzoquinol methylase